MGGPQQVDDRPPDQRLRLDAEQCRRGRINIKNGVRMHDRRLGQHVGKGIEQRALPGRRRAAFLLDIDQPVHARGNVDEIALPAVQRQPGRAGRAREHGLDIILEPFDLLLQRLARPPDRKADAAQQQHRNRSPLQNEIGTEKFHSSPLRRAVRGARNRRLAIDHQCCRQLDARGLLFLEPHSRPLVVVQRRGAAPTAAPRVNRSDTKIPHAPR